MVDRPERPDLDQLSRQAKGLLRVAKHGGPASVTRIAAVSDRLVLASAQLAVAREHRFAGWARLPGSGRRLPSNRSWQPTGWSTGAITSWVRIRWATWRRCASTRAGLDLPADLPNLGVTTRALIDAGAPVNGGPAAAETPPITAASYHDAEVARILIAMTGVLDMLVAAGARIHDVVEAAAAGESPAGSPPAPRWRSGSARCGGTTVDGPDEDGSTALREAAYDGRAASVRHRLANGVDPARRDTTNHSTPLDWCRHHRGSPGEKGAQDEVEAILGPLAAGP